MIKFIDDKKMFILSNGRMTYAFFINSSRALQHLYFGEALSFFPLESMTNLDNDWSRTYFDHLDQSEKKYEDFFYDGRSMMEIPSFGFADKRGAQFVITNNQGLMTADFRYHSHRIYQGKPQLEALPSFHSDSNVMTLEITLNDQLSNVELITAYSIYPEYDAILRNNKIINKGEPVTLNRAYSLTLDLANDDFHLMHFPGDWMNERQEKVELLERGLKRIASNQGRSSHEHNPGVILLAKDANQDSGNCFAFNFVYSGNFSVDFHLDKLNMLRVLMGINDENFEFHLEKNHVFECPEAIIVFSNHGLNGITHHFHHIIRDRLIPQKDKDKLRPVILNSWEGCYLTFDTATIIAYIDAIADMGIELFVLDDGWFGRRDDDTQSLGDWVVNKDKIDLHKVIQHCHNRGLQFGLWFEPEMINPKSDLFSRHPEYALGHLHLNQSLSRHQFVLDTCNPHAVSDVYQQIKTILEAYPIDYVKWDHNRNIYDSYSSALPLNRQGETYHRLVLGSYKLMDMLVSNYPSILFESCASGGGRYDLGMLYYMPQVWTSDEMDPFQRLFIQYSTSRLYPLSTMGSHIGKHKTSSYGVKAKIAALGIYGLEIDPRTLSEMEKSEINQITKNYKKYRLSLINNGTCYHLKNPYVDNQMALQSVDTNKSQSIVLVSNIKKENIQYRFLKLKGLDEHKLYRNSLDQKVYSGEYYHKVGLNLCKGLEFLETKLIHLQEVA